MLESVYEQYLAHELALRGLRVERQRVLPVIYKGFLLEHGHRLDLVVEERFIVEVKAAPRLLPVHEAQVITYLKLTGLTTALLVNSNVAALRQGLRRLTYKNGCKSSFFLPGFPPSCEKSCGKHGRASACKLGPVPKSINSPVPGY